MDFKYFIENDMNFDQWEVQAYNFPLVKKELEETGAIKIKTLMSLGVPEPIANYLSRVLTKKYGNNALWHSNYNKNNQPKKDEYFYHVTLKSLIPLIKKYGMLSPNMEPVFSNYKNYSKGKLFFCELDGVNFWKERVEQHAFHNTGKTVKLVVLRFFKESVSGSMQKDEVGEKDSGHPSYYTTQSIPMSSIHIF